jgi:hypothetical protein
MPLAIRTIIIAALFMSATDLAFGWSPKWDQCKDINNKATADRALAACNDILKDRSEQPNYAMALRNRCGIKYTKGDYDGALADCDRALELEPTSATSGAAFPGSKRAMMPMPWRTSRARCSSIRTTPTLCWREATCGRKRVTPPAAMPMWLAPRRSSLISNS